MAAGTGDTVVTDSVLWLGDRDRLSPVYLYRTTTNSSECELFWTCQHIHVIQHTKILSVKYQFDTLNMSPMCHCISCHLQEGDEQCSQLYAFHSHCREKDT